MDPQAKKVFRYPELVEKMSKGNFEFVMELYQNCVNGKEEDMFVSPFSISAALVMTFMGARGETQEQIRKALRFDQIGDSGEIQNACEDVVQSVERVDQAGMTLLNANGMYVHKNLEVLPDYQELLKTKFNAVVSNVDFVENGEQVRTEINSFVEKITKNRIKDLVGPDVITPDTRLVLVNAIYFKGNWMHQLKVKLTRQAKFTLSKGNTKMVSMMTQERKFRYVVSDELQCSMIELPYEGNRFGMYILLPNDVGGLVNLESKLNNNSLAQLLDSAVTEEVKLSLPRFKIESSFELGNVLKNMGIQTMFVPNKADFSGITTTEPLCVSAVLHKAFLEVNEKGSKAAAATAVVVVKCRAVPRKKHVFLADHPFLVLIRDKYSGLVLFAGRVTNPVDSYVPGNKGM